MYKIYFFAISLLCFFSCQNDSIQNDSISSSLLLDSNTEDSINNMIDKMTIQEKVGQTCQITLDAILKKDTLGVLLEPHEIDQEKLKNLLLYIFFLWHKQWHRFVICAIRFFVTTIF